MMYGKGERDMVMLQHKFEVELKDGTKVNLHVNAQKEAIRRRDDSLRQKKTKTKKDIHGQHSCSGSLSFLFVVTLVRYRTLDPTFLSYPKRLVP